MAIFSVICLRFSVDSSADLLSWASSRELAALRLSQPMWESWRSGDFWVSYAARKNFAFDAIFWQKLDCHFFGPGGTPEDVWEKRIELLDEEEKMSMEPFVQQKLEDMKERTLAWDPDEYFSWNAARKRS